MKTKTIFKTLALAMLMPAMMLNTACSSDDDAIANNNETPAKKGYTLPVTINVTRQSEAATRATYTDNGNKTGSLSFSSGDQLFIYGEDSRNNGAGQFAGTLQYVDGSDGTFRGTITTENTYSGTVDELFSYAGSASSDDYLVVELLPYGYETYGFISITENEGYDDELSENYNKTFATTKALAVEQFSWEWTDEYDNGFALSPGNSILNFTISGLTASTEVNVALTGNGRNITGEVTTDGSGTATFAIGVPVGVRIENYSLTVGGNAITLPEKLPEPGKIYNISRSVAPAGPTAYSLAESTVGMIVGSDGKAYAAADKDNLPSGVTAVAKIVYVGSDNGESAPYNNGLALALSDANGGSNCKWKTSQTDAGHTYKPTNSTFTEESGLQYNATHNSDTYPAFKAAIANNGTAAPTGCSAWFLASGYHWVKMANAAGGYDKLGLQSDYYWSSTEYSSTGAWRYSFSNGSWNAGLKGNSFRVRACLAF